MLWPERLEGVRCREMLTVECRGAPPELEAVDAVAVDGVRRVCV